MIPRSFWRFYGLRLCLRPQKRQKELGQYSAILSEQAWSIKDLLNGQNKIFPRWINTAKAHLVRSVSQSEHRIHFIFPARGLDIL